jgi:hypothetical protein
MICAFSSFSKAMRVRLISLLVRLVARRTLLRAGSHFSR